MRVIITGASGQLGQTLVLTAPDTVELSAFSHRELDITDREALDECFTRLSPDWVINAAAYTSVDKAESKIGLATAVNATGAANVAQEAASVGARMVHLSTDFVFDGRRGTPYAPGDPVSPVGAYGKSKALGEQEVISALNGEALILRTAWVYSVHSGNFVSTMLKLMAEREALRVVSDQIGTPTWTYGLARAIWDAIEIGLSGYRHWTDAGVASWYDFAHAIRELALTLGLLERAAWLEPIPSRDYPTPAPRPAFSVLDKDSTWHALGYKPVHWREALGRMLRAKTEGKDY